MISESRERFGRKVRKLSEKLKILRFPGDVVSIRDKSKNLPSIRESLAGNASSYEWLQWNSESTSGSYIQVPERELIPENIKESLIVELYSK